MIESPQRTIDTATAYYTAGYADSHLFNRAPLLVPADKRAHQWRFYAQLCQHPDERAAYDRGWHAAMAGVLFPVQERGEQP